MSLTPDQQKRLGTFFDSSCEEDLDVYEDWKPVKSFLAFEIQLERERLLTTFHEFMNMFFREHDVKPCDCWRRYVEGRLN